MPAHAILASNEDLLPLRTRHREEMNCQIVHDSIHRRPGWTLSYGCELVSEKIVFHDRLTTAHPANGAALRRVTPAKAIQDCLEARQGGGEWLLELDGAVAGKGGILFHYNRPYAGLHMEVTDTFRRRRLGTYFVQELKRACYELGAVPCARCSPTNHASRRTLQSAGFVPFAHILTGPVAAASATPP